MFYKVYCIAVIMAKSGIILASGGLDSGVTAYYAKKKLGYDKLLFLFFDYGQRALKEEEYCSRELAKNLGADFKKIELKWLGGISTALLNKDGEMPDVNEDELGNIEKGKKDVLNYWVPCRNSVFLIAALAHAEALFLSGKEKPDVFIGLKCEGRIPMKDTTPEFVKAMNKLAEEATNDGGYKVIAPLIDYDKDEIVKLGCELGVPFELTYSCYAGNKGHQRPPYEPCATTKKKIPVHCGVCENCVQRKKGFYWAGVEDVSTYKKSS